jgi:tetratricopeptide (TPR) repeat protein
MRELHVDRPLVTLIRAAQEAAKAKDFERALILWGELRGRAAIGPRHAAMVLTGLADALAALGRSDEAQALADEAAADPATAPAAAVLRLKLAEQRADWPGALQAAASLSALMPQDPRGQAGTARAMLAQGRLIEAEQAAEAAMTLSATFADPYVTHARVAMARRDWPEALRRWSALEAAFPKHPTAARLRAQIQAKLHFLADEDQPADSYSPASAEPPAATAEFLMRFESLGPNCEFGFLQQAFGAEPLGLLRWAGTRPSCLIDALKHRFEGMGDPQQTRLMFKKGPLYFTEDLRYGIIVHTGISRDEAAADVVYRKQCRRLAFLRDRLLADLESHHKVFVHAPYRIEDPDLAEIMRLLGGYGPNTLLCVRLADAGHPPGTIDIAGRLVTGYSACEGWVWEDGRQRWTIDHAQWLSFLHAAWHAHTPS